MARDCPRRREPQPTIENTQMNETLSAPGDTLVKLFGNRPPRVARVEMRADRVRAYRGPHRDVAVGRHVKC